MEHIDSLGSTSTTTDRIAPNTDQHTIHQGPTQGKGDARKQGDADADNTKPKGGRRTKAVAEHPLQCQQVNSETGLHMEMQKVLSVA